MNINEILARLDAVRSRGTNRWQARCPAHEDRNPSLAIAEGERGLLVKCWAGCTLDEITRALGLTVRDLFYDANPDPRAVRAAQQRRQRDQRQRQLQRRSDGLRVATLREAEAVIRYAQGIDISNWSHTRLDRALNRLADAYGLMEQERDGD